MSDGFVKTLRSKEAKFLAKKHPNAFILLFFIAQRACREIDHPSGYSIGQCHIGDYQEYGLTEKEYRTAKKILVGFNHIKIVETCRTRKTQKNHENSFVLKNDENRATERATVSTTYGTLVEICSSSIYDINPEADNQQKGDRNGDRGATEGRPKGDEQERKKSISYDIDNKEIAQTASRPRSKDSLSFDFEKMQFVGITDIEKLQWQEIYKHISVEIEIARATEWIKSNPSKSNKSLWRKFLTGWLQRASDKAENKKAFSIAGGDRDRRTKDINGLPVENAFAGRF